MGLFVNNQIYTRCVIFFYDLNPFKLIVILGFTKLAGYHEI